MRVRRVRNGHPVGAQRSRNRPSTRAGSSGAARRTEGPTPPSAGRTPRLRRARRPGPSAEPAPDVVLLSRVLRPDLTGSSTMPTRSTPHSPLAASASRNGCRARGGEPPQQPGTSSALPYACRSEAQSTLVDPREHRCPPQAKYQLIGVCTTGLTTKRNRRVTVSDPDSGGGISDGQAVLGRGPRPRPPRRAGCRRRAPSRHRVGSRRRRRRPRTGRAGRGGRPGG